jgi:hypothetical protein
MCRSPQLKYSDPRNKALKASRDGNPHVSSADPATGHDIYRDSQPAADTDNARKNPVPQANYPPLIAQDLCDGS